MSSHAFRKAVYDLLNSEPFFAHYLLNSNISFNDGHIPTAGTWIKDNKIHMSFNLEWLDKHSPELIKEVIKHEVMHNCLDHFLYYKHAISNQEDNMLWNIAQDRVINEYLNQSVMPKGSVTVKSFNEQIGKEALDFQNSIYYFNLLKEAVKESKKEIYLSTLDSHGDNKEQDKELPKEIRDAVIKASIDQAIKNSKGIVPNSIANILQVYKDTEISWQSLFRNFVLRHAVPDKINTRKKLNRRYMYDAPGYKKERKLVVGVCTDSSGSVSDAAYSAFLAECDAIKHQVAKMYLVQADCIVQDVQTFKKKDKMIRERKGYGGTAYQPAIDKCKELKCDIIIYFGDFDCADTPTNPNVPFLWVGVGNQPAPGNFGKVIRLRNV